MTTSMTTSLADTREVAFRALGTSVHVVCTAGTAEAARAIAERHLAELDAAASRFRADSEVSRLAARAAEEEASTFVSPVLAEFLAAALRAAELTGGLVDPTVGAAVVASGYDADIALVRSRAPVTSARGGSPRCVPGWQSVRFDPTTRHLTVARGTLLDLGSSAKAHAADVIATALEASLPGGFLVNLGGDIATSGTLPEGGWLIGVEDADRRVVQTVLGTGQAFATSSTRLRRWSGPDGERHHVIDPRTGRTSSRTWAQVTCAGATALEANAASTASIVLGPAAVDWLAAHGIPARLQRRDGSVVTTTGWPEEEGGRP